MGQLRHPDWRNSPNPDNRRVARAAGIDSRAGMGSGGQPDSDCARLGDAQWCHDSIRARATGAITQPPMHWIDRPTFQQAVEVPGHR
jgi:hypothetical protein